MTGAVIFGLAALASPWGALPAQTIETRLSGQAILIGTYADPVATGRALGETRVVQPIVMLDAGGWRNRLMLHATADFEGLTIPHGELAPGDWGEGYADRRHPHTYVHEVMVSAPDVLRRLDGDVRTTVSVGKGFVPFGTDDPMNRPVERFPVNHHLSQILERALVMVALDGVGGRLTVEASLFNGDEPESPGQLPRLSRFGDSWSVRLTARPARGLEAQVSRAIVASPENRAGAGTDAHKWSGSLRAEREEKATAPRLYGLLEWARTSEAQGAFVFHTVLLEGAITTGRHQPYYRFERTERPEDARTLDPFRTVRPHLDNSILGIDRWSVHTVGYAIRVGPPPSERALETRAFLELSYGTIAKVNGGVFDPLVFYGHSSFWTVSGGVRVGWGMKDHRMGHYGVPMVMPMVMEQ